MRTGWFTSGRVTVARREVGVRMSVQREKIRFPSGGDECAAWHYPGINGGCVVMAAGTAVTMGPGTDAFAARFAAAGFDVLAFDFRRLGGSRGLPPPAGGGGA